MSPKRSNSSTMASISQIWAESPPATAAAPSRCRSASLCGRLELLEPRPQRLVEECLHVGHIGGDRFTGERLGRCHVDTARRVGELPLMNARDPVCGTAPQNPGPFVD